jgi:hypothetical protein
MPKGVYPHTHLKPKVYPAEMVQTVTEMYAANHTQIEIAIVLGVTQRVIFRLMRNHKISARVPVKRDQTGAANHSWRGGQAGYQALHLRVAAERGQPFMCEWCGRSDGRFEWANLTGDYPNVNDYARLCVSCHRYYDADRRRVTGQPTMTLKAGDAQ